MTSQRVVTNAEGFQINNKKTSTGKKLRDRVTFTLLGVMQLIAVGIIAKQLKSMGYLPKWVDTDFTGVRSHALCAPLNCFSRGGMSLVAQFSA